MATPEFNERFPVPCGMVGIYVIDGRVIASVSDFDRATYGGYTLEQSQRHRVENSLARAVVKALCSDVIVKALDAHDCQRIVSKLSGKSQFISVPEGLTAA
jgi:hypothetical protein